MNAIFLYQGALAAFGAGLVLALLCAWHKPLSALLVALAARSVAVRTGGGRLAAAQRERRAAYDAYRRA